MGEQREVIDPWPSHQRQARSLFAALLADIALVALGAWRWPSLIALGVVLLSVLIIAAAAAEGVPCPRCRKPFFRSGLFHNSLSNHCLHCELPKWHLADGSLSSLKRHSARDRSQ